MKLHWTHGNRVELLENGEEFFPAVFAAIDGAHTEVLIETFILFDDPVGRELQQTLIRAARRGVAIDLTIDGYGSPDLSDEFIGALTEAGVRLHVFGPQPKVWLGLRTDPLRRLHRKIVVVDHAIAFVGGINYSEDHLDTFGPMAKQDYSVRVTGPLVDEIHRFALQQLVPTRRWLRWRRPRLKSMTPPAAPARNGTGIDRKGAAPAPQAHSQVPATARHAAMHVAPGAAEGAFVTRDNHRHRTDIERAYRTAIRMARTDVFIANAYFFPGYRLLRDLRRASRRGVRVVLILQGEPDMAIVRFAARLLYRSLVKDGVEIHEYCRRPMHAKVAVVDGYWSTVGSSNLDPLSLSLNLEANVVVRDRAFGEHLRGRLLELTQNDCKCMCAEELPERTMWQYVVGAFAFHLARGLPVWLQLLQDRRIKLRTFWGKKVVEATQATPSRLPPGLTSPPNDVAQDTAP